MDIRNKLVLFKKRNETDFKDVTDRLKSLDLAANYYNLTFADGKAFPVKLENVIVMELIEHCNLANSIVFYQDRVKTDIVKIDAYGKYRQIEKYKVFCENGFVLVCDSNEIQFYKFSDNDKNLVSYWKACARELNEKTIRDIMSQQYDDLIVNPNSVLYSYINQRNYRKKDDNSIICPFSFNNSQLKAIRLALEDKISIIKGPPGTGKTETILNIISNLIVRGKSIAIISSNNSAIENVEEKLNKRGYGYLLASLGNGERKAEFFNKTSDEFQKEKVDRITIPFEKLSILSQLFESENKSKRLKEEIDSIKLEKEYYENFNQDSLINVDKYKFKNSQDLIEYVTQYQEDTKDKQFTMFLWLKLIFKYGFKKSLIRAKDRDKVITSLEHKFYFLKVKESSDELSELERLLAKNKLEDLKSEYKTLSKQYLDYYINSNVNFKANFTQQDYKKRFSEFIKRYPIITSTAISFMSSIKSEYMFDYVIIDESSQVTIPTAIPLLNKCRHVVIVGDDKQLSPIDKFETACKFDQVFDCSKQSLITSFMQIYVKSVTTLLEHYRCEPSIIGFCNLKYYDGQLIPFTVASKDKPALCVYFTSEGNHMRRLNTDDTKGVYNQREIDTIDEIMQNKNIINVANKDIGIISPYRLQVDKLQEKYEDIECDTVHKFQGREKNTIIFSPVLDSKASKHDFEFVDNASMINVTVSRAVNKLVLVANEETFNEKGKHIHDLINYISYKSKNGMLFKSKCVSIFDFLYKSKETQRKKMLENSSSKSNYESEKLLRNLLDNLLKLDIYKQFSIQEQVKIKNLTIKYKMFNEEELSYIRNNCSVDFLVKDKISQDIVCVIEVDGVAFHENNKKQLAKDKLKDSILSKCNITLLRLKTNGSNETFKIKQIFDSYLNKFEPES